MKATRYEYGKEPVEVEIPESELGYKEVPEDYVDTDPDGQG